MRYLLDSHTLLWALDGSPRLEPKTRAALTDESAEVWFSSASAYELGLQVKLRRLPPFTRPLQLVAVELGFHELTIDSAHAERAANFPLTHRDPWDRIIAAQAIVEGMTVVTRDREIAALGAPTFW